MKRLFLLFVYVVLTKSILSQNPSCWKFDFNDPSTINQFQGCFRDFPIFKSYNDSSITPYRPESQYYLSSNSSHVCFKPNLRFNINMVKTLMTMAINFQSDVGGYVNLGVTNTAVYHAIGRYNSTNGWTLLPNDDYSVYGIAYPDFEESEIDIGVVGLDSNVAIEYLHFYNPEKTDENCVPLQTTTAPAGTSEIPPSVLPTGAPQRNNPTTETSLIETPSTETTSTAITSRVTLSTEIISTETPSTNLSSNPPWKEFDLRTEFQQCDGLYLQLLTTKLYANSQMTPFREKSLYFLTNIWEGMSCMESTLSFSLTENSVINSAIYFDFLYQGAWLSISIFDKCTGKGEVVFRLDNNSSDWRLLNSQISTKYQNARIMIQMNMNSRSRLAIEYLNISNV